MPSPALGDAQASSCLESAVVEGSMATPHVEKTLPRHFLPSFSPTNTLVCNTASTIDKAIARSTSSLPIHNYTHTCTLTFTLTPAPTLAFKIYTHSHTPTYSHSISIRHHDRQIHPHPSRRLNHPLPCTDLHVSFPPPCVDASTRNPTNAFSHPQRPRWHHHLHRWGQCLLRCCLSEHQHHHPLLRH